MDFTLICTQKELQILRRILFAELSRKIKQMSDKHIESFKSQDDKKLPLIESNIHSNVSDRCLLVVRVSWAIERQQIIIT